ncbi:MAG: AbrB/MazE/SpoVT family DNA-binding domain-containing protein [Anaerolineae bacterium]|nr:AbrB/MazE/SpoVT family DNA-binding domain-containing protein [Anaerolineae bacterium]
MKTRVNRWGNSLALRIPKAYADELGIEDNAEVEISVVDGRLVVQTEHHYTLEELLAQITPENLHPETDWGDPIGKEEW